MQFRRNLPGAGSTDFYLTDPENGGLSIEQQMYAADLIMAYRRMYPNLKINAVWDFGMEEADPVQSEKFGVFEDSRDNAVYNAKMLTISLNHAKVRKMPCDAYMKQISEIEEYYAGHADLAAVYAQRQKELMAQGIPWPKIEGIIREEIQITPCAENMLSAGDL